MDAASLAPGLIPELDVSGLEVSTDFYARLGFEIAYDRPDEGFAYLKRGAVHLMLQAAAGPGRRFRTAHLERPYGRGINFQMEVEDIAVVHRDVLAGGHKLLVPLEERWYRVRDHEAGNRQFVVADPDGYLWRPFEDLGYRPV